MNTMINDFLFRAVISGLLLACICGPFGSFIVWRRMVFFGDMLAHTSLLGVAFGILVGIDVRIGIIMTCVSAAIILSIGERQKVIGRETILVMLAHSTLALGMVALSIVQKNIGIDLMTYLFGDILSVSYSDIWVLFLGGLFSITVLIWIWKPFLVITVIPEIAAAENIPVQRLRLIFMLLMALVIGMTIKIVGVLLITALMVIPAASARFFARTPEHMVSMSVIFGTVSVLAGITLSWCIDTPTGPSIVISAIFFFILASTVAPFLLRRSSS